MRMCAHKGAHTWKRWLLAFLIAHRWLFTTEKTESDRKWCSPCAVAESAPWTFLPVWHCTDRVEWQHQTQSTVLSQTACQLSCVGHPVWSLVSVKTRAATLPGSRRAASPSTGKLLLLGTVTQQPQLVVHCPSSRRVAYFTQLQCKAGTTSQEQSHAACWFS